MAEKVKSLRVIRSLSLLGADIKLARKKRRISIQDFADRVGVSTRTIIRLEKGDVGVSIGTLAMAFMVLGEIKRLEMLLDVSTDDTGLMLTNEQLPKRINRPRKHTPKSSRTEMSDRTNSGGVGF